MLSRKMVSTQSSRSNCPLTSLQGSYDGPNPHRVDLLAAAPTKQVCVHSIAHEKIDHELSAQHAIRDIGFT